MLNNFFTNCFIIQQIGNETHFADKKTVIMQRFTRLRTNLRNLGISQDICYVRLTDNVNLLTIYGQREHLLNNNIYCTICLYIGSSVLNGGYHVWIISSRQTGSWFLASKPFFNRVCYTMQFNAHLGCPFDVISVCIQIFHAKIWLVSPSWIFLAVICVRFITQESSLLTDLVGHCPHLKCSKATIPKGYWTRHFKIKDKRD